jgi:hypothetical protein
MPVVAQGSNASINRLSVGNAGVVDMAPINWMRASYWDQSDFSVGSNLAALPWADEDDSDLYSLVYDSVNDCFWAVSKSFATKIHACCPIRVTVTAKEPNQVAYASPVAFYSGKPPKSGAPTARGTCQAATTGVHFTVTLPAGTQYLDQTYTYSTAPLTDNMSVLVSGTQTWPSQTRFPPLHVKVTGFGTGATPTGTVSASCAVSFYVAPLSVAPPDFVAVSNFPRATATLDANGQADLDISAFMASAFTPSAALQALWASAINSGNSASIQEPDAIAYNIVVRYDGDSVFNPSESDGLTVAWGTIAE